MKLAAGQVGAQLLPALPEEVLDCDDPRQPALARRGSDCLEWNPRYSRLLPLRDARGALHQALVIDLPDWSWIYARLARRGDDLILLVPKVTRGRQLDHVKQCACGAMSTLDPLSKPRVVFAVDGLPEAVNVRTLEVPVTVDYVRFECATYLL